MCVVVCTCALVCAFMCVGAFIIVDIQIYKYTISNHTSTKQDTYSSGNCSACLQLTQYDVTVCTYNVILIQSSGVKIW